MFLTVPVSILAFYVLVSSSFSNVVAFTAFSVSSLFIGVSMWLLGWILD
jgi:hypothetical protein